LFDISDSAPRNDLGYKQRYEGHRNNETVKGVNFFGPRSEFVVSGSDCGHVFFWDKKTANLLNLQKGDARIVNCLEPHPFTGVMATSGIESNVKLWFPTATKPCSLEGAEKVALF
jgi:WD repeat-containing protein 42A